MGFLTLAALGSGELEAASPLTSSEFGALEQAVNDGGSVVLAFHGDVRFAKELVVEVDTTLDATGHAVRFDGNGAVRHFVVTRGTTLRLVNIRLINGHVEGDVGQRGKEGGPGLGGSILNLGGRVELVDCRFIDNRVLGGRGGQPGATMFDSSATTGGPAQGGAIYADQGEVVATNCVFAVNGCQGGTGMPSADGQNYSGGGGSVFGGALSCTNAELTLINVRFTNNVAQAGPKSAGRALNGGGSAWGGAVAHWGSLGSITNCVFEGNQAIGATRTRLSPGTACGGGLFHAEGRMTVGATRFTGNTATGGDGAELSGRVWYSGDGKGGAVCNQGGSLELINSTLAANAADGGFQDGASLSDAVAGNGLGGGVYNTGRLRVDNCTISGNTAQGGSVSDAWQDYAGSAYGGGIFNDGGELALVNTTIASNSAVLGEGQTLARTMAAGCSIATTNGLAALTNSILACLSSETNVWGVVDDGGHNIASDGSAGFTLPSSRNSVDPMLGPLADNGGLTPTMALRPGSPAIDSGDDSACPPTDQRGVGRPSGPRSDIGAFEVVMTEPLRITSPPASVRADAGLAVLFQVAVNTDKASFQWTLNGTDLAGETNSVLLIPSVRSTDQGDYAVQVRLGSESITSEPATLAVMAPTAPVILVQPEDQAAPEGQPVALSVVATNLLRLKYQWQHNGTNLPRATKPVLEFASVSAGDAGTYTAVVSTEFLSTTSAPAVVTVLPSSFPSILEQPVGAEIGEGHSAVLSVVARGGEPLRYQWRLDGVEIPGADRPTLTLSNVQATWAGAYSVEVGNSTGELNSEPAVLTVRSSARDQAFIPSVGVPDGSWYLYQIAVRQDGMILVIPGSPANAALLSPNGDLDVGFHWPLDHGVDSLAVQADDKILINGYFESVEGVPRKYLARLNPDGSLDTSFDAGDALEFWPRALAQQPDGKVLAFSERAAVRFGADGVRDPGFTLNLDALIGGFSVQADGKIVIGQWFSIGDWWEEDGFSEYRLSRYHSSGARDESFHATLGPIPRLSAKPITFLSLPDGKLVAGGVFSTANGVAATNLVRLNLDGSVDGSFRPPVLPPVLTLAVDHEAKILAACDSSPGLFRLNPDGSLDPAVSVNARPIYAMAVDHDGGVLILGKFANVDGIARPGLARLVLPTSVPVITSLLRLGPTVRVAVPTLQGGTYVLERAGSVHAAEWTAVRTVQGQGTKQVLVDTNATAKQQFYRVGLAK